MRVLVIASHPDDDVLGAGGTIRHHVQNNDTVKVVYLTSGEKGCGEMAPTEASTLRESEAKKAGLELGTLGGWFWHGPDGGVSDSLPWMQTKLEEVIKAEFAADLLYAPHTEDGHVDHQAAGRLALTTGLPIRFYEIWTPLPKWTYLVNIEATVGVKRGAIRCHQSQTTRNSLCEGILALNAYRGLLHGPNAVSAEAFLEANGRVEGPYPP